MALGKNALCWHECNWHLNTWEDLRRESLKVFGKSAIDTDLASRYVGSFISKQPLDYIFQSLGYMNAFGPGASEAEKCDWLFQGSPIDMKVAFVRNEPHTVHEFTDRMRDVEREHQYVQQAAFGAFFSGMGNFAQLPVQHFFGLRLSNQLFSPLNSTVGMNNNAMYPDSGKSIYGTGHFVGVPQGQAWPYQNEPAAVLTFAAIPEQQQTQNAVAPEGDKLSGG